VDRLGAQQPADAGDGIADSHEAGLAYLADVVGDIGPASSPARRETFLTAGYEMINFLVRRGVRLIDAKAGVTTTRITKAATSPGVRWKNSFRRGRIGRLERQGAAAAGQELWIRGADHELRSVQYFNRAPRAFAGGDPSFPAHRGGARPAASDPHNEHHSSLRCSRR